MEGEAAGQQQQGVDGGKDQLQLVGGATGQGVHRPKGEVGGEEAREGHPVCHQEGGKTKHAVIGVRFVLLLADAGAGGGEGGHWLRVSVRGDGRDHRGATVSEPVVAASGTSSGATP